MAIKSRFSPTPTSLASRTPKKLTPIQGCPSRAAGDQHRARSLARRVRQTSTYDQGKKNSRLPRLPHSCGASRPGNSSQLHSPHTLTHTIRRTCHWPPRSASHLPAHDRWTSPESGANSSDPPTPSASNPSIPYSFTTTLENSRNTGVNSVPDLGILSKVAVWPVSRTATPQTDSGQGLAERPRIAPSTRNRWIRRCP